MRDIVMRERDRSGPSPRCNAAEGGGRIIHPAALSYSPRQRAGCAAASAERVRSGETPRALRGYPRDAGRMYDTCVRAYAHIFIASTARNARPPLLAAREE